jgi:hypothetical protein
LVEKQCVLILSGRRLASVGCAHRRRRGPFTSDRGITPAAAAKLADEQAAQPTTGDESLPDDRYMRTLDPRVRLSTSVALPVEHDPITLAEGRPDHDKPARWADLGVTEALFGLPDRPEDEVAAYVERLAGKLAAIEAVRLRAAVASTPTSSLE